MAATSSGESGLRRSSPAASAAKHGPIRRVVKSPMSHPPLQEVGHQRPREIGIVRLVAVVVRMAEAVIRIREVVPLHGLAVGEKRLPQLGLDGRCRDVVFAAGEYE